PAKSVQRVVRVLRAEAREQAAVLISRPATGRITQVPERIALADIDSAVAGSQPRRHGQAVGEYPDRAGLAARREVIKDDDVIGGLLDGQHLRIARRASDPQAPLRV